jgi:hypothetical protein
MQTICRLRLGLRAVALFLFSYAAKKTNAFFSLPVLCRFCRKGISRLCSRGRVVRVMMDDVTSNLSNVRVCCGADAEVSEVPRRCTMPLGCYYCGLENQERCLQKHGEME